MAGLIVLKNVNTCGIFNINYDRQLTFRERGYLSAGHRSSLQPGGWQNEDEYEFAWFFILTTFQPEFAGT